MEAPSDSIFLFYPFCDSCRKSQKCLTGPGLGRKSPPGPALVSPLCCYYAPEHNRGQKLVEKDRMFVTHQEVVLRGVLHHSSYVAHGTHVVVVQHLVCKFFSVIQNNILQIKLITQMNFNQPFCPLCSGRQSLSSPGGRSGSSLGRARLPR